MRLDITAFSSLFCFVTIFVATIVTFFVAEVLLQKRPRPRPPAAPARQPSLLMTLPHGTTYAPIATLLTDAEQTFLATLRSCVAPELIICPQVRLANLVRPTARNTRQNKYDFYRIQAKCGVIALSNDETVRRDSR